MSIKKEYILEGLSCANCAAEIEREVAKLPEVAEVSLNLFNNKLSVAVEAKQSVQLKNKVVRIANSHEPDIKVKELVDGIEAQKTAGSSDADSSQNAKGVTDKEDKDSLWRYLIRLLSSIIIITLFSLIQVSLQVKTAAFGVALLLAGHEVFLTALRNLGRGRVFDENFLMGIASLGAFIIGEQVEAVAVLVFYGVGELTQDMAVRKSRRNIAGLMDIRPDYANLIVGGSIIKVSPEKVRPGDIILVKPGERVPLDGMVVSGSSFIDTRALTGESTPTEVCVSDQVISGTINTTGLLEIKVSKSFGESTVSKILELVSNTGSRKAESEKFITKFARYYTPAVVFTAIGVAFLPPLAGVGNYSEWIYRALSFLIISCPCALVISIPISFFGGIGGAARHGVLIKGSNYLDALNHVDTIVFDKTGTLTKGSFSVTGIYPTKEIDSEKLLKLAIIAEYNSNHPVAKSLKDYYEAVRKGFKKPDITLLEFNKGITPYKAAGLARVTELSGLGMQAVLGKDTILAGNLKLMHVNNIKIKEHVSAGTIIHVAWNNSYMGYILISDELKPGVEHGIKELKKYGVKTTVMLTGDRRVIAEQIAEQCGVDNFHAELLPQDKVELFEQYKSKVGLKGKTVFVGDGINDAPVLAGADIGIAMGGIGSDAAIEAADVVIMNDDIHSIVTAIKVARKTRTIVIQNIIFALGTKLAIMALAFFGITSIWFAIFADVGVALIALLNAMRAMRI